MYTSYVFIIADDVTLQIQILIRTPAIYTIHCIFTSAQDVFLVVSLCVILCEQGNSKLYGPISMRLSEWIRPAHSGSG